MRNARRLPRTSVERSPIGELAARRHAPVRTCAGCGERAPQSEMHRMALAADAALQWVTRGGRGAYLHPQTACRDRFVSGKRRIPGLRALVGREARVRLVENWLVLS